MRPPLGAWGYAAAVSPSRRLAGSALVLLLVGASVGSALLFAGEKGAEALPDGYSEHEGGPWSPTLDAIPDDARAFWMSYRVPPGAEAFELQKVPALRSVHLEGDARELHASWAVSTLPADAGGRRLLARYDRFYGRSRPALPVRFGGHPQLQNWLLRSQLIAFAQSGTLLFVGLAALVIATLAGGGGAGRVKQALRRAPREPPFSPGAVEEAPGHASGALTTAAFGAFLLSGGVRGLVQAADLLPFTGRALETLHSVQTLAIAVQAASLAEFMAALFGGRLAPLLSRARWGPAALLALGVGLQASGALYAMKLRPLALLFAIAALALSAAALVEPLRRGDRKARPIAVGLLLLLALAAPEVAQGFDLPGLSTADSGVLFFSGGLLLALQEQLDEQQLALRQTIERLETRNREVASLNAELRFQVAERSRELAHATLRPERVDPAALPAGAALGGRYTVVRRLGQGAMGAVCEVRRTDGARLALKVLRFAESPDDAARFAREAEIASQLSHPNLVPVVDVGTTGDGRPYLVMEYVEGDTLKGLRRRFGERPFAWKVLAQIAAGLAELHRRNVVHRDLKPGNVLVAGPPEAPVARLADFGIARRDEGGSRTDALESGERLTKTDAMMGTPLYMAPEQAVDAHRVSPAADVFSFGVLACEVLTGRVPFSVPPVHRVLASAPLEPPQVRFSSVPGIAPELARLLDACLSPEPSKRPTAEQLAAALA